MEALEKKLKESIENAPKLTANKLVKLIASYRKEQTDAYSAKQYQKAVYYKEAANQLDKTLLGKTKP